MGGEGGTAGPAGHGSSTTYDWRRVGSGQRPCLLHNTEEDEVEKERIVGRCSGEFQATASN